MPRAGALIFNVMSTMWDENRPIYFRFAVSTAKSCNTKKVMCSWELSHKPFNLSTERLSDIRSITIFDNWNQEAITDLSLEGGILSRQIFLLHQKCSSPGIPMLPRNLMTCGTQERESDSPLPDRQNVQQKILTFMLSNFCVFCGISPLNHSRQSILFC